MVSLNPPWEGPPIEFGEKKKRGWVLIDNETSAEEAVQEIVRHINGVWIKQITDGKRGWYGGCLYIIANEPVTKENFRKWYIEDMGEDPIKEGWKIEFAPTLEVE